MTGDLRPESAGETAEIVAGALASETALEIAGAGTKRGIGQPVPAARRLVLSGLAGLTLYEPEELVVGARPGTALNDLRDHLERHGQMLAFEPPDFGPLLGSAGDQTVGGVVAGNLAGPRRVRDGAARDHFLGLEAVSGRGEAFRAGGRVVKNVTGYDLCKLMCGSWGTLAVLTDVVLKVVPAPERTATLLLACPDPERAVAAMTAALSRPESVSAAAWLPEDAARPAAAGRALAALRLEGFEASVGPRLAALRAALSDFGEIEELGDPESRELWRDVADARAFAEDAESAVWRVSVPPQEGARLYRRARETLSARGWLDWGGGLVWLAVSGAEDAGASVVRPMARRCGGHALLLRASEDQRRTVGAFQPEPEPVARITRRLKEAFDPRGILNPGRMHEGV